MKKVVERVMYIVALIGILYTNKETVFWVSISIVCTVNLIALIQEKSVRKKLEEFPTETMRNTKSSLGDLYGLSLKIVYFFYFIALGVLILPFFGMLFNMHTLAQKTLGATLWYNTLRMSYGGIMCVLLLLLFSIVTGISYLRLIQIIKKS